MGTPAFGRWCLYPLGRWMDEGREGEPASEGDQAYAFGGGNVAFRCFRCTQKLRLPVRTEGVAHCENCGNAMEVET
jgi:hypothetical protein